MPMEEKFMLAAIAEAEKAAKINETPIGAVIVRNGEIIASGHNMRETKKNALMHAEIIAIRKAEQVLENWRLDECDMYVTLEPCPMCGWAILQSRIKNLYFGSYDNNYGAFSSKIDLREIVSTKLSVYGGILEDECDEVLKEFFKQLRDKI